MNKTEIIQQPQATSGGSVGRLLSLAAFGPVVITAGLVLCAILLICVAAPLLTEHNPVVVDAINRLKPPSDSYLLGTDAYGRDVWARLLYGGQMSLLIGASAVVLSVVVGTTVGLLAGYIDLVDKIVMRIVDGLMAIPNVLLALSIVALFGASFWMVLLAITIPEIPRVIRLVRAVVLSVRQEPYVEAAILFGVSTPRLIWRHLFPNTIPVLIVQGSYVFASAILTEAILSFLGAGVDPSIPSWGNMMADGRNFFQLKTSLIFWPGLMLSLTILSINIIGDAARDRLDPRMAKQGRART